LGGGCSKEIVWAKNKYREGPQWREGGAEEAGRGADSGRTAVIRVRQDRRKREFE